MFIVNTSLRAFLIALLPLLFVHGALLAMAPLDSQANPPTMALPPPDKVFGMLMLRVGVEAAGLMLGHFICRGFGVGSRAAYALIGAVAAAGGYAISNQQGLAAQSPYEGVIVTAEILPTLTGMVEGVLYGQFAGREGLWGQRKTRQRSTRRCHRGDEVYTTGSFRRPGAGSHVHCRHVLRFVSARLFDCRAVLRDNLRHD